MSTKKEEYSFEYVKSVIREDETTPEGFEGMFYSYLKYLCKEFQWDFNKVVDDKDTLLDLYEGCSYSDDLLGVIYYAVDKDSDKDFTAFFINGILYYNNEECEYAYIDKDYLLRKMENFSI